MANSGKVNAKAHAQQLLQQRRAARNMLYASVVAKRTEQPMPHKKPGKHKKIKFGAKAPYVESVPSSEESEEESGICEWEWEHYCAEDWLQESSGSHTQPYKTTPQLSPQLVPAPQPRIVPESSESLRGIYEDTVTVLLAENVGSFCWDVLAASISAGLTQDDAFLTALDATLEKLRTFPHFAVPSTSVTDTASSETNFDLPPDIAVAEIERVQEDADLALAISLQQAEEESVKPQAPLSVQPELPQLPTSVSPLVKNCDYTVTTPGDFCYSRTGWCA